MEIYLVRHGDALPALQDDGRPLSASGRGEVECVAAFLAQASVQVEHIRHSGKLRAKQTAEILAEYLKPAGGVAAQVGLAPNDDVKALAQGLGAENSALMLVGHLPFMSQLASLLLFGNPWPALIDFETATAVCLSGWPGRWVIKWVMSPDLVRT